MTDNGTDLHRQPRRKREPERAEKLPPSDPVSERQLLGCILYPSHEALAEAQSRIQNPDVFFDLANRAIWEVITEMSADGFPVDVTTVCARLRAFGQEVSVGGSAYISKLPDDAAPASISYHINRVLECYQLRRVIQVATEAIQKAYEREDTTDDLLDWWESACLGVRLHESQTVTANCKVAADQALGMIETMYERRGALIGVGTGLHDLDRITGGMIGGQMIVLAGLSSHGKTSLGMGIAESVAIDQKLPVGCMSLEMSEASLLLRMLCSRAQLNIKHVREGFLAERDMPRIKQAHREIRSAPLYIDSAPALTVAQISARARRMRQMFNIKLLVLDYLQLVRPVSQRGENRQVEVSNISNGIKRLAGELDIPVLVMVQMNNNPEKEKHRKPRLSDLRESTAIGHDADICLSLYRPASEDEDDGQDSVPMNLRVVKFRNGPAGLDIRLIFQKQFTKFVAASKINDADIPEQETLSYGAPQDHGIP